MILSELTLSQRRPPTTNQRQRTVTSVECPSEGQGLRPAFAIVFGCVLAVVVNLLGPRYEITLADGKRSIISYSGSCLHLIDMDGVCWHDSEAEPLDISLILSIEMLRWEPGIGLLCC